MGLFAGLFRRYVDRISQQCLPPLQSPRPSISVNNATCLHHVCPLTTVHHSTNPVHDLLGPRIRSDEFPCHNADFLPLRFVHTTKEFFAWAVTYRHNAMSEPLRSNTYTGNLRVKTNIFCLPSPLVLHGQIDWHSLLSTMATSITGRRAAMPWLIVSPMLVSFSISRHCSSHPEAQHRASLYSLIEI